MTYPISSLLLELGLSDLESNIYQIALGLGIFPATSIANHIKSPRSTIRYNCDMLVEKGLMIMTKKGNTKLYAAENPTKLYALLYEEELAIKRKKEQLALTIKELQNKYNPNAKLPKITFYEGFDGLDRLNEFLLSHPTKLYSLSAGDYYRSLYPDRVQRFREKAKKVYKEIKIIRAKKYEPLHRYNKNVPTETRYFRSIEELKIDFQITDENLVIRSYEGGNPIGLLIQHKPIIDGFLELFKEIWDRSISSSVDSHSVHEKNAID